VDYGCLELPPPHKIKEDRSPAELRRLARREPDGRVAARLYAIANALDGLSRADAARQAGMELQALRDAVVGYNTEEGLRDRPKGHAQRRLSEGEEATLAAVISTRFLRSDGCGGLHRVRALHLRCAVRFRHEDRDRDPIDRTRQNQPRIPPRACCGQPDG
jgi:hypothetical protein